MTNEFHTSGGVGGGVGAGAELSHGLTTAGGVMGVRGSGVSCKRCKFARRRSRKVEGVSMLAGLGGVPGEYMRRMISRRRAKNPTPVGDVALGVCCVPFQAWSGFTQKNVLIRSATGRSTLLRRMGPGPGPTAPPV